MIHLGIISKYKSLLFLVSEDKNKGLTILFDQKHYAASAVLG